MSLKKAGAAVVLSITSLCTLAASPKSIRSAEDFSAFLDRYYLEPQPHLVSEAIEFMGHHEIRARGNTAAPSVAFFAEVFAQNKARIPEWTKIIDRQPDPVRSVLNRSLAMSAHPKQLLNEPPSPHLNDVCWGGFMATGDPDYLAVLLRQLGYINERSDLNLYTTAASAKWSLASNALRHPIVRSTVEAARDGATGPRLKELNEILTRPPGEIRQEMMAVLREQRRTSSFEANAIWVKGIPALAELKTLDPAQKVTELSIGNEEDLSLLVAYRSPARNEQNWAKVTYRFNLQNPDGTHDDANDKPQELLAGEGTVPNERIGQWAVSQGRVTLRFSNRDSRGVYTLRVTIKDHVGNQEVVNLTKVRLE